jgi:hypothetical protein
MPKSSCSYFLKKAPPKKRWRGDKPLPKPGDRVEMTGHGLGPGTVVGYFYEYGELGIRVRPDAIPADWQKRQGVPGWDEKLLFGFENWTPLTSEDPT